MIPFQMQAQCSNRNIFSVIKICLYYTLLVGNTACVYAIGHLQFILLKYGALTTIYIYIYIYIYKHIMFFFTQSDFNCCCF